MRVLLRRFGRLSLMSGLVVAGCYTVPEPQTAPTLASRRFLTVEDALHELKADDGAEGASVPRVRLFLPSDFISASRYVDASLRVSDDAYVLVVAVDLDRRVRVVYPQLPDESNFVSESSTKRLEKLFMGFGSTNRSLYAYASNPVQPINRFSGAGLMIALASDRPFQLERILDSDGDWDEAKLSRLIFQSSVSSAEQRLGSALVLTGQEFSSDYGTFGVRNAFDRFSPYSLGSFAGLGCGGEYTDAYYGFLNNDDAIGSSYQYSGANSALVRYSVSGNRKYVSYLIEGGCGRSYYSPWVDVGPAPTTPVPPRDTTGKRDSVVQSAYRTRIADVVMGGAVGAPGRSARPIDPVGPATGGIVTAGNDQSALAGSGRTAGGFRIRPMTPTEAPAIRVRPPEQIHERRVIDPEARSTWIRNNPERQPDRSDQANLDREQAARLQQSHERVQAQQEQQRQAAERAKQAAPAQQQAQPAPKAPAERLRPVIDPS